jgi:hypothetical protein
MLSAFQGMFPVLAAVYDVFGRCTEGTPYADPGIYPRVKRGGKSPRLTGISMTENGPSFER